MKRSLLVAGLLFLGTVSSAAAQDGVYPRSGEIRTEVRIEGCPYGPQPEVVNGAQGRALHARWQRDLCARPRVVGGAGWVVPRLELAVPAPAAPAFISPEAYEID